MSKFKVGDKVKLKPYSEWEENFGINAKAFDRHYNLNSIYVICGINNKYFNITPNPCGFSFKEHMLEPYIQDHFNNDLFEV